MLELRLPEVDGWDEAVEEFVRLPALTVRLEHSLLSLSKWEGRNKVPFFGPKERSTEEMLDYVSCMADPDIPMTVLMRFREEDFLKVNNYIQDKMTATTITDHTGTSPKRQIVTSELIYAWLTLLEIPYGDVEHWHLNRLLTLIRTVQVLKDPKKNRKPTPSALAERDRLNAMRNAEAARRRARRG